MVVAFAVNGLVLSWMGEGRGRQVGGAWRHLQFMALLPLLGSKK